MIISKDIAWCEKYRPRKVADCILPEDQRVIFQKYVDDKQFPNLLLTGTPGTGKTTVAKALCDEIGVEWLLLNGSDENGIDVLRTKVKGFAATKSIYGGRKAVIVDEADGLTAKAQDAFRGVLNDYTKNCSFIFTCNYKSRLLDPLISRFATVEFRIPKQLKMTLAKAFLARLEEILKTENVGFVKMTLVSLITRHFPDYRKILNEAQRLSNLGALDAEAVKVMTEDSLKAAYGFMRAKDFPNLRRWVGLTDKDMDGIISCLYEDAMRVFTPETVPAAIVLLGKYDYQSSFVLDKELNLMACLTEIALTCEFNDG